MKHTEQREASPRDEGRFRLLIEAVTDYAIYMLDATGVVTSWNPGAQRFKGYQAAEIIGRHFSLFYTNEDREAGLPGRALETAVRDGRFENEGWRVRKDGSRFWAHVIIDPICEPSGKILGFAKITRDITDSRIAAEALRRSEQQFKLLVQNVTDYAIYMLDLEGRVTNWNLGAQKIKGYRPDEIVGEHFSRFYTDEDRERGEPQRGLEIAAREGRFEKEGWRVRKDGTRFWANIVIDTIRDESGALLGYAKVTRDITERREADQKLLQAREALYQAQKMEAVGQLTGGVAHDFNNLLMAILGSLHLLRKRIPENPKITPFLDNAIQGAQRGASLTQRMLAFARRQKISLEPVDLPALVRGMTDLLRHSLGPAIAIEVRFPLVLPAVLADANQLEMALLNLAVNARDAMPEGGPLVIAAREEDVAPGHVSNLAPGRYARLSVTDTGDGMDEATLARAVEPFFTTKEVGKGTGLGFSVVHGITEQLGGRLMLTSKKGEGTTAELWLPLAPANAEAAQQAAAQPPELETRPLVVLAVDDESIVLMNTVAMLEDLGHTVFVATSGKQALDMLRREKTVDLVITDQAMPHMTGTQLAEAIRAEWPDVPVILATGYADVPGAGTGQLKLSKPFDEADLARAVADAIQRASATGRILKFSAR